MGELSKKTIVITGGTNGIGEAASLELAKKGAEVIIVGRNPEKTKTVVGQISEKTGNFAVHGLVADLSSMAEVCRLSQEILLNYPAVNILVNNVGGIFATRNLTIDGFEYTFALNHLSYFLLTNLLLDRLKANAPARIINVSSGSHEGASINFDDLQSEQHYNFGGYKAYGQSKLANLLFTYELARRLAGTGVTVNAVHPGTVASGFGENNNGVMKFSMKIYHQFSLTPEQGADTVVYLASSPDVEGITGKYWTLRKAVASSPQSYDQDAQKRLWTVSAQLAGIPEAV
jgi:NAD(P)-dependent dehydrogenase (short-subunit alcohol dehydrogenase family)